MQIMTDAHGREVRVWEDGIHRYFELVVGDYAVRTRIGASVAQGLALIGSHEVEA
ncbi:hypothetical protein [Roseococcus sp.]|uniref:hypothetical protein n=1 Tax=Roseococcus sp. TaxID=2109646 RepID=UPI003BAC6E7D